MATITLKGKPINTVGTLPKQGSVAPDFVLTKVDLSEIKTADVRGKKTILNIFPSLDTPVCAASVRKFNEAASQLGNNLVVLCISADLPFAQSRFCGAEGLKNVIPASTFRHPEFGKQYGVTLIDGPLQGLMARAIVVLDATGQVIYTQQVAEITDEPDYAAALAVVKSS